MDQIISLLRAINDLIASGNLGGGGLSQPGTPDNITIVGADGESIADSGVSKDVLTAIQNLTSEQLEQLAALGVNIALIQKWANLLGVDIVNEWDENTQYSAGDLVIKDNVLYRFTQASTGTWNAAVVEPTYIITQMAEIVDGTEEETVVLEFTSEDNAATFNGLMVTATIEGGSATNYTIANNTVTFTVEKGTNYTIDLPSIVGYKAPSQRSFNAIYSTRTLTITYLRQDDTNQLVRVRSIFTTSGNNTTTSAGTGNITFTITPWDAENEVFGTVETRTVALSSGVCQTYIPVGSTYTVSFPDHASDGYINPKSQSFTAARETNFVVGRYLKNVSDINIVDSEGNYMPYAEWDYSTWDGTEEMYLHFNTVTLQNQSSTEPTNQNCSFMIPLKWFIQNNSYPNSMRTTWGNYGISMQSGNLTYDGYTNTQELIAEAANRGTDAPACSLVRSSTYQIEIGPSGDTQTLTGFLGAKDQWGIIAANWEVLTFAVNEFRKAINESSGSTVYAETSSNLLSSLVFWTSTQDSASHAWTMYYGSLSNYYKYYGYICLPFYAF